MKIKSHKLNRNPTGQAKRLAKIEKVLGTLIVWIAQSSVGCLSVAEAETLLADLNKKLMRNCRLN